MFVLIPAIYQADENIFNEYVRGFDIEAERVDLDQPNRMLRETFNARSLRLIDPLTFMRQMVQDTVQMYGKTDRHLTETGHRVVAEFIAPAVESYLIGRSERD